ncbi:MAG: HAD-IA family hydrolase, partial [archaeon]|nr:HAD-IA family hydrolase [archaeon]
MWKGFYSLQKTGPIKKKLHTNVGVHERVAKKLHFLIDQYFDYLDTDYSLSVEGKISESKLMENLSRKFNYPKKSLKKFYIDSYKKMYGKNRFLIKFAKKLKNKGFRIAILSDQWHLSNPALIPKKFHKIFSPVLVSCSVGVRKPDPRIYKILIKKLKVRPEEILFIDDRPWNLDPARKLRIKTLAFTGNENFEKQIKKFGLKI